MESFKNESEYLIHMLSGVVNSCGVCEKPDGLDFDKIYRIAKLHSAENTAFYAVESLKVRPQEQLLKKWSQRRDMGIMLDITQLSELEAVCSALKNAGIRCMPLKGSVIKELYPQSDMRSMSDLDILVDPENAGKVGLILTDMGYTAKETGEGDDVYIKGSRICVEIHKSLFESYFKGFSEMFADPWENAVSNDGFVYRMESGYFFAYMLAHAAKHYKMGGTGIRSFMDIHIFLKKHGNVPDIPWESFDPHTRRLCRDFIKLSEIWFGDQPDDGSLDDMKAYIISGGTYGDLSRGEQAQVESRGRARYLLEQLFPSMERMIYTFPVLKKAPILLPFCWIARPFVKLVKSPRKVRAKIKALFGSKNSAKTK